MEYPLRPRPAVPFINAVGVVGCALLGNHLVRSAGMIENPEWLKIAAPSAILALIWSWREFRFKGELWPGSPQR